jgi:hypothetical protein
MIRPLLLTLLLPVLMGFDSARGREALDLAFHNLYGVDVLAAVELEISGDGSPPSTLGYAYGRKSKGGEVRTLLFSGEPRRDAGRALLFQRPGENDRMFVSSGKRGEVRPVSTGQRRWQLFGSDFAYDDFRAHTADEYRIEVLGSDVIDGEECRVLRLRPFKGPYRMQLTWLSSDRPVILRVDYFDKRGLWKRYRAKPGKIAQHFDWLVPMQDEMLDLRTGRRTRRYIRNIMVDTAVPDEMFSLTQLSRGRMPSF